MNHADLSSSGSSPVGSPVLAASGRAALIAALFGLAVSAACAAPPPPVQQPNPLLEAEAAAAQAETRAALDDLDQRIEQLDKRMETLETLLRQALGPSSPDSDTVYSVPIAGLPYVGPEHAKVTIVKAYEFACHYCLRVVPTLRKLQADYAGDIKIVYAPYIVHPEQAVVPALAACAADKQGKFSEMEAMIWTRGFAERDLSEAKMNDLADQLGLDMGRYRNDVHGEPCMESLRNSFKNLSRVGTSGTPTFFINGRYLVGAQPITAFKAVIDEELAKAEQAIAGGTAVADYYRSAVIEAGQKSL